MYGTNILGIFFHFSDNWYRPKLQKNESFISTVATHPGQFATSAMFALLKYSPPPFQVMVYLPFLPSFLCFSIISMLTGLPRSLSKSLCHKVHITSKSPTSYASSEKIKFQAQVSFCVFLYTGRHTCSASKILYSLNPQCEAE